MDLILWRHAEAVDDAAADLQRRLTPKGERQAVRMAEWLNRMLAENTRVLVSPAERCQQTAAALRRRFQTHQALAATGTVPGLLSLARWPQRREPVLIVGHQPTLGATAALLMGGGTASSWAVRKGAVWWLRQRQRNGLAEVVLLAVCSPDSL